MKHQTQVQARLAGCFAAVWLAGCARTPAAEPPRPAKGPVLRLLSYNVNYGIAGDEETLAAIRNARADVALLLETNVEWERALRRALSAELPHMTCKHRGGAGGLCVLSRRPLRNSEFLPPTAAGSWFPAVRMVAATAFGPVQILGVHLRPAVSEGGSYLSGAYVTPPIRENEIEGYYARLDPNLPTVIAGDFNEGEDGAAAKFLTARGFASALRRYAPGQPTWRWPTVVGELRKELDHVFYDGKLDALAAEVRDAGRSDHLPVIAVIAPRSRR